MQHIETIELGSSQSSITFSSIPQDYDDLVLVLSGRNSVNSSAFEIRPNSATTNLSGVRLTGNGSSVSSSSNTIILAYVSPSTATDADTFGNTQVYFSNYSAAVAKSISIDTVNENNSTTADAAIIAALWNDTTAITSIEIVALAGGNAVAGTVASLYGISAGGDGTVTTS